MSEHQIRSTGKGQIDRFIAHPRYPLVLSNSIVNTISHFSIQQPDQRLFGLPLVLRREKLSRPNSPQFYPPVAHASWHIIQIIPVLKGKVGDKDVPADLLDELYIIAFLLYTA